MSSRASLPTFFCSACLLMAAYAAAAPPVQKKLLWGDTHLHTSYSADAYLNGNFTVDPETAYRYARGEPVVHPFHQARVQIDTPLDFLVVSDHAEFLGGIRQIHKYGIDTSAMGPIDTIIAWGAKHMFDYVLADGDGMSYFQSFSSTPMDPRENAAQLAAEKAPSIPGQAQIVATAWREETLTADAYNTPGEFTAFIGWEWTSVPGGANLHRVIFTDGDAESAARFIPYSRDESPYPEDLWRWLDKTSAATGDSFIAIPHNSNISKGFMFPLKTLRGEPFTPEYLRLRRKWEPVVEATQTKGDSETFPTLSPEDDFADFERYTFYIQAYPTPYKARAGDFMRSALKRGLLIARDTGINPYQFGMIGSTDSHTGLSSPEEHNFQGEQPADSIPDTKAGGIDSDDRPTGWDMSASGRAAVWADNNTREAILQAFARREVYATTGPRIVVRFDGGWYPTAGAVSGTAEDLWPFTADEPTHQGQRDARALALVPMGADLPAAPAPELAPGFTVSAMKDPKGANLDRIQIIKGWVDAQGESHEKIFDVSWSGSRTQDEDGALPEVGNTVDSTTASYANTIGAPTLQAVWQDPQFNPAEAAFYYARILEIPTPRHSLYDAVALGAKARPRWPDSLQERAYTSPIWYQPPPGR
jgi:Protein of unknown function (DUF3604)